MSLRGRPCHPESRAFCATKDLNRRVLPQPRDPGPGAGAPVCLLNVGLGVGSAPGVLEALLEQGFRSCYGQQWLKRTVKRFLAKRWLDKDLAGVLTGPLGARWAAPHRLPFLPMRTRATSAPPPQRAHSATA